MFDLYINLKNNVIKFKLNEWQIDLYKTNIYLLKISEKQILNKREEIKNNLTIIDILYFYVIYFIRFIYK
jgi:hypothetical protein